MSRFESHPFNETHEAATGTVPGSEDAPGQTNRLLDGSGKANLPTPRRKSLPEKPTASKSASAETHPRVKLRDLCAATRQLASLLRGGMPLVPALEVLIEQLEKRPLAPVLEQVRDRVNAGTGFADALEQYQQIFSPVYIALVRAGEISGTLEEILARLGQMLEKKLRFNNKLKAAFAYPALMAVAAAGVVAFLMAFVVPSLTRIFLDMNQTLPAPTRVLIGICTFLHDHLWPLLIGFCGLVVVLVTYLKSRNGRIVTDRVVLRLPLVGKLILQVEAVRLTRTLGILLASGIGVLEAFAIVRSVVQNRCIRQKLDRAREEIGRGDTIARAIRRTKLFGPMLYHSISIGEASGNLEEQLLHTADLYEDEFETLMRSLTTLLEPAILLGLGLIVGFIVLATLLPIFEINQMW
jgi:general secretion pathway protein F